MNLRDSKAQIIQTGGAVKPWLRAAAALLVFSASAASACPRCVDATPYKTGLFWAIALLLPLPFILVGGVVAWIIRHTKPKLRQP